MGYQLVLFNGEYVKNDKFTAAVAFKAEKYELLEYEIRDGLKLHHDK